MSSIDVHGQIAMDAPAPSLLDRYRMQVEVLEGDVRNGLEALVKEQRVSASLKAQLTKERAEHPQAGTAKLIAKYYTETFEKTKAWKFGDARQKVVIARLKEEWSPVYICRAIDGFKIGFTVNRDNGTRYDDLEFVCRNEIHLERFHHVAEVNDAPTRMTREFVERLLGKNHLTADEYRPTK